MPQSFKTVDPEGVEREFAYEAYRWKHLTRFLLDHENGENALLLEVDDVGRQSIFRWGYQSDHDGFLDMHWHAVEAEFPETHKQLVAVNLPLPRIRPSVSQAEFSDDGCIDESPYVRSTRP